MLHLDSHMVLLHKRIISKIYLNNEYWTVFKMKLAQNVQVQVYYFHKLIIIYLKSYFVTTRQSMFSSLEIFRTFTVEMLSH